jgi:hypothetical protein
MTGKQEHGFLMLLDEDGAVSQIFFGEASYFNLAMFESLTKSSKE